jgi:hypothetical protein
MDDGSDIDVSNSPMVIVARAWGAVMEELARPSRATYVLSCLEAALLAEKLLDLGCVLGGVSRVKADTDG